MMCCHCSASLVFGQQTFALPEGRPETEGDATAAVANQTAKEDSQSNASTESKRPRTVADSNGSAPSAKADRKAGSNSTQETAKSEEIPAASKAVASKTATEVKAEEASAIAKVDSSSEEAEAAHEQQAAEEREEAALIVELRSKASGKLGQLNSPPKPRPWFHEAASTVLGWTPQPSARVDMLLLQMISFRGLTTMPVAEREKLHSAWKPGQRDGTAGHRCRQLCLILRPCFCKASADSTRLEAMSCSLHRTCRTPGEAFSSGRWPPPTAPSRPGPRRRSRRTEERHVPSLGFAPSGAGALALHDLCRALAASGRISNSRHTVILPSRHVGQAEICRAASGGEGRVLVTWP